MESDSNDSFGLIDINSDDLNYLNSTDCWLTSNDWKTNSKFTENDANNNDIKEWLSNAFIKEISKGVHMNLVNKLNELELSSSSSTLYSCEDKNESKSTMTYETHNRTFEVQTHKKSLNGTFILETAENTFIICNEDEMQMNNIDDIEKMAAIQEENLKQSCSNSSSPSRQRSPIRSHLSNFNDRDKRLLYLPNDNKINSNTLTRNSLVRNSILTNALMDDSDPYPAVNEDNYYYENGYSPDEPVFRTSDLAHNSSTPLVSRTEDDVELTNETPFAPKIMPNISNLRYGHSKIVRSQSTLYKRLQPLNKGFPNYSSKTNYLGIKSLDNTYTRNNGSTLVESKMPSDSSLMAKNGFIRQAVNHQIQAHTLGRICPTSQTQQLVGKMRVEAELNRNGTTSTTTTNNNAKPSKVQTKMSKIPGPKSIIRSEIAVSGVQTVKPVPVNKITKTRKRSNHTKF